MQRYKGFSEANLGIVRSESVDRLNRFFELAYAELKVQLVAEGSLSNQRALGVAITSARHVNVEGSTF